jgi:DNA-binding transcriptional regulator YhcF (GntR family)
MSRAQPGAVILDQLRDRIVTGLYFGNWQPGERLPSIRDIADAESVDRKTAAAAYHRLEEEGLVEVKARSGVFLRDERANGATGHSGAARWRSCSALAQEHVRRRARPGPGYTDTVLRLFNAVADVENTPVPVIEEDEARPAPSPGAARVRRHRCAAGPAPRGGQPGCRLSRRTVRRHDAVLRGPRRVAHAAHAAHHGDAVPRPAARPAGAGGATARSWSRAQRVDRAPCRAALRQRAPTWNARASSSPARDTDLQQLRRDGGCVFVWPGCDDVLSAFADDDCVKPVRLLSEATLDRVRTAVLDAALRNAASAAGQYVQRRRSSSSSCCRGSKRQGQRAPRRRGRCRRAPGQPQP